MNELLLIVLPALTLALYGFSFLFAVGIVWRVERELDASYKFLTLAVLLLLLSEILALWPPAPAFFSGLLIPLLKFLTALALFSAVYLMRDLVRRIDGEKNGK